MQYSDCIVSFHSIIVILEFYQNDFILTDLKHYYLQQMGIDIWVERDKPRRSNTDALAELSRKVAGCTRCNLHCGRTQTVFARGNSLARLMVIGEAPGFHEDKQGLPFVGKAGGLLNNMLQSIGLTESDVYIANVIKCRPPENRDPTEEEVALCSEYLGQQIQLIQPSLILALGRFAGQFLLKSNLAMNQMRSKDHAYESTPCIVTYHPAYLLRKPSDKKKAFDDLLRVQKALCLSS